MAFLHIDTGLPKGRALKERIQGFFAGLKAGLDAYGVRKSRMLEIQALQAKSDEELARLGISRERIVHYVFRDKLGF